VPSDIFGEVLIPVAKIVLEGKEEIGVEVIVDIRAVISIFPESICDLLGLDFDDGRGASVRTAAGEIAVGYLSKKDSRVQIASLAPKYAGRKTALHLFRNTKKSRERLLFAESPGDTLNEPFKLIYELFNGFCPILYCFSRQNSLVKVLVEIIRLQK